MKKTILVDMDGVLADFETGFLKEYRNRFPKRPFIPLKERTCFYLSDQYPQRYFKDIMHIFTRQGFFENLPPVVGAKRALSEMQAKKFNVFICTTPLSVYENCVLEKFRWVEKNLGYEWCRKIIITHDKTLVQGDILIDDNPDITGITTPVWQQVFFDAPINRHITSVPRLHWGNWHKVLSETFRKI